MSNKPGGESTRVPADGRLTQNALRGIRDAILEAKARQHAPLESLMALQPCILPGGTLHLDFSAEEILGQPLVLLRPGKKPLPPWWSALSKREKDVALLLAKGMSNRSVAQALGIALSTAKDHVHRVLKKSGKKSRAEIAGALSPQA